jgi:flavin-dependent dehydrogenase
VASYGSSATDLDQRTVVEAVSDGWWYVTPLPDGRLVVAYLSDADLAAHRRVRTHVGWEAALRGTTEIGARVVQRRAHLEGGPRPVGADSSRLEMVCGAQWWAVGDAAAAHDPLSSQGLMTAVESGMRLGQAIAGGADGAAYAAWVERTYAQYLAQWLGYYALEQRWPAAPFWQRRHTLWQQVLQG